MTSPAAHEQTLLASRYRLEHRVGFGSMGAVWRARDERLLRTVAVKQLLTQPGAPGYATQGADFGDARERMLREGRLAARLQHPNTVGVYDVVVHDDVPWLVMEYLESRTLGELTIQEGPLEPRRAAEIGRQVADGLVAAHAAGIVHRDIKPSNVLIGTDGSVKITDFGVSRAADDVQLTRTGLIAGTPAYLSPEVARGQTPTPASDVFALGSTIYACVEGEPPFGLNDNAYAMLFTVGSGEVRPPARAGALAPALMRMLDRDATRRPTAAEARDELARVAAGGVPPRPTPVAPVVPPMRTPPSPSSPPFPAGTFGGTGTRVDLSPPGAEGPVPAGVGPDRGGYPGGPGGAGPGPVAPGPGAGQASAGAGPGGRGRSGPTGSVPGRRAPGRVTSGGPGGRVRNGWWAAGVAAVLLLAIVIGVAVAGPSKSVPPSAAQTSGATGRTPAPSTPGVSRDGQPSAGELEAFVRDYYDLLPGDVEQAWDKLGPKARRDSGDFDSYRRFYGGLSDVRIVQGPTAVDGRTVRASLQFVADGRPVGGAENYTFQIEPDAAGDLRMTSFSH
jgi:hypothetical protein